MHIFLTGEIGVGKSTALQRFLRDAKLTADGFRTFFDERESAERQLYFVNLATGERQVAARFSGGERTVIVEVFDDFGARAVEQSDKRDIIVMDELGVMEQNAERFKSAVLRKLDGEALVAGVVKAKQSPFLDAVRSHKNVRVLTVTLENRDSIPEEMLQMYRNYSPR